MRRTLTTLAVAGLLTGALAAPAAAGPEVPTLPADCRELQALIGMQNVKDCRDDEENG